MAIDAFGTEMALERGHDLTRVGIVCAICRYAVAVFAQRFLKRDHGVADRTWCKDLTKIRNWRRFYPMPDTGFKKCAPGKLLAGVLFARRRNIGMCKHPNRGNAAASLNTAAKRRHRGDLASGKIRITVVVTGICDFDSD